MNSEVSIRLQPLMDIHANPRLGGVGVFIDTPDGIHADGNVNEHVHGVSTLDCDRAAQGYQTRLYRAIYHLAFKLFLDYATVPCNGYVSPFNMDFEDLSINVTFTCKDQTSEDYLAISRGHELDITRWLCSDVPIAEFRKIFGHEMSEADMYKKVFDVVSKPKLFTSIYSVKYFDPRSPRYDPIHTYVIPSIVLHIAERMIQDKFNANWIHYYCINADSFDRYRKITNDSSDMSTAGKCAEPDLYSFAYVMHGMLKPMYEYNVDEHANMDVDMDVNCDAGLEPGMTVNDPLAEGIVNGHNGEHFNIC